MKFSVITPSFRQSSWLKLCIASVADQGVAVEHIVQDGGSDDGTLDWLPQDARVKAFVERDLGMYDAINRGLRRAEGDILAYLNCDEQYLPGALAAVEHFFRDQPGTEVVFADAVVVDTEGHYLFHRKVQRPSLYHTWTCPLSTLSCATFLRRAVLTERQLFFDADWRVCGDREWMLRLLQQNVRMAVLRHFTSVFTRTGQNLSLETQARAEEDAILASAPTLPRKLRLLVLLHHRLRRVLGGIYHQKSFAYSLYTQQSPQQRVAHKVARPTNRWRW